MNAAQIKFELSDKTTILSTAPMGIVGFMGVFKRGPVNTPSEVFSSVEQFQRVYGGLVSGNDDPLIVQRILQYGAKVRVCGVRHYADITDANTITSTKASISGVANADAEVLFDLVVKYPGADYNNLKAVISAPSNGQAGYFNLSIYLSTDKNLTQEDYKNLKIASAQDNTFLDAIANGSELVTPVYKDLTVIVHDLFPSNDTYSYVGGADGSAVQASDYIGNISSSTGLHAFDGVSDIYVLGSGFSASSFASAGATYANGRQDLQFVFHMDNSFRTDSQVISAKDGYNIDTPFAQIWMGGLKVLNPVSGLIQEISAIGDILALSAVSEKNDGPYRSFAGLRRGVIIGALGVVNNMASGNDYSKLDNLANHQVNAVINGDGKVYLSGNFSTQIASTHLSFNNVVRLVIYIKNSLRPILRNYLEEPNDIPTWKEIYLNVKPFLDSLISPARAVYDYAWDGDQFVDSIQDVQINNSLDIGAGKYKVILRVWDIVSLQEFKIVISLTDLSVEFESGQ